MALRLISVTILGLVFMSNSNCRYITKLFHGGPRQIEHRVSEGKLEKEILRNWDRFISTLSDKNEEKSLTKPVGSQGTRETVNNTHASHSTMGTINNLCDNAQDNLQVDWNGSPVKYTCYSPKVPLPYEDDAPETYKECDEIAENYRPKHICMNQEIKYDSKIPTHEMHRPLWATYGEYLYVPPQRWLHNVEHGGIVMLYHPCTHTAIVNELSSIIKGCIRKHIISATPLSTKWPLTLVGWGCRLYMNNVNAQTVVAFIKEHGLTGPEGHLADEGVYNLTLLGKAKIPQGSDYYDSKLCPQYG